MPAGFRVQSISWPTAQRGWALGAAPCPTGDCTVVARTADGGRRWSTVGAPDAPLAASGEPGVRSIRFADERYGWAYDPALFGTADGGRSWRPVALPGRGQQVVALAAGGGTVYLAVSTCLPEKPCGRAPTLWRSPVGRLDWRPLALPLPAAATQVVIAARGSAAYVLATQVPLDPDVFYASTDGGARWVRRIPPCRKDLDESLVDVAVVDGPAIALLCVGNPGQSRAIKHVYRSPDAGLTKIDAGITPELGIQSRLAATAGTLLVSSVSSGSWLYRSTGGSTWDTPLALADGGTGWNDPVFTTEQSGYVVSAPAAAAPDLPGVLLQTRDGGGSWSPVAFGS